MQKKISDIRLPNLGTTVEDQKEFILSMLRLSDEAVLTGDARGIDALHQWTIAEATALGPNELQVNAFDLAEYLDLLRDELIPSVALKVSVELDRYKHELTDSL